MTSTLTCTKKPVPINPNFSLFSRFDVIFHVGDFAYDLHSKDGERGHKFMNMIEPIAARVPYMTCAGNHEMHDNFSHYEARFSMLGDRTKPNLQVPLERRLNNQYHSMQIGPATIIVISTEYYFYTEFGWEQIKRQYEWLEEQLKLANANRAERPWIIVMGHRSPYCIKKKGDVEEGDVESECDILEMERPFLRKGIHMRGESSSPIEYGLEELFYKVSRFKETFNQQELISGFFTLVWCRYWFLRT